MNPWHLSASDLLIWGIVLHLVADWPLQNHWMAVNKQNLKHPAGYFHALIHCFFLAIVFGKAAIPLAIVHLLIDTRKPVIWWGNLWQQSPPLGKGVRVPGELWPVPLYDMGIEVRIWTDQVFHIMCIAIAALLVA